MSNNIPQEQKVLMAINTENVLIHVGNPATFNSDTLIEYARDGFTIKTISLEQYQNDGYKLYEPLPASLSTPHPEAATEGGRTAEDWKKVYDDLLTNAKSRYGFSNQINDFIQEVVRYIAASSSSQQGELKQRVEEVLNEKDGYWHPCSGCHETEDGHEVGEYPYSDVFKCKVGSGCHECGGIGIVWNLVETNSTEQGEQQELWLELMNRVAMQIRFHTISHKTFPDTVDDIEKIIKEYVFTLTRKTK
jgi:hypothetical protein